RRWPPPAAHCEVGQRAPYEVPKSPANRWRGRRAAPPGGWAPLVATRVLPAAGGRRRATVAQPGRWWRSADQRPSRRRPGSWASSIGSRAEAPVESGAYRLTRVTPTPPVLAVAAPAGAGVVQRSGRCPVAVAAARRPGVPVLGVPSSPVTPHQRRGWPLAPARSVVGRPALGRPAEESSVREPAAVDRASARDAAAGPRR